MFVFIIMSDFFIKCECALKLFADQSCGALVRTGTFGNKHVSLLHFGGVVQRESLNKGCWTFFLKSNHSLLNSFSKNTCCVDVLESLDICIRHMHPSIIHIFHQVHCLTHTQGCIFINRRGPVCYTWKLCGISMIAAVGPEKPPTTTEWEIFKQH